jgi:hypothetical protein
MRSPPGKIKDKCSFIHISFQHAIKPISPSCDSQLSGPWIACRKAVLQRCLNRQLAQSRLRDRSDEKDYLRSLLSAHHEIECFWDDPVVACLNTTIVVPGNDPSSRPWQALKPDFPFARALLAGTEQSFVCVRPSLALRFSGQRYHRLSFSSPPVPVLQLEIEEGE